MGCVQKGVALTMAAILTSSLPLSVISAFLSPVQRWSRHGLITIGCSLGMTLIGSEVVIAQPMDLPAVARCQMEVASQPNREALIRSWIHRAGQTDALAALCLSFSPNPNAGESLAWLRRAADLGLPDAQLLLGADLEVGFKSPPNSHEAMRWYRKAAQADFPFAQYELGSIYSEGRANQRQDLPEAYYWAQLAARHQFRPAKELADTLSPQLSHDERARIDGRIKKWKRVVS